MNKKFFWVSVVLNGILLVWLISLLILEDEEPVDLSIYTQQDLTSSIKVKAGMSDSELAKLLGDPLIKDIDGKKESWHYCKTGKNVDEYFVVVVQDGLVVSSQFYTVNWLDLIFDYTQEPSEALIKIGGLGDCRFTLKRGTYEPQKS